MQRKLLFLQTTPSHGLDCLVVVAEEGEVSVVVSILSCSDLSVVVTVIRWMKRVVDGFVVVVVCLAEEGGVLLVAVLVKPVSGFVVL